MSEEPQTDQTEPTIEDIEKQFTELFNQMSAMANKLTLLGKRIREETSPLPDIGALEQEYIALPVSTRPSWFQYAASHGDVAYNQSRNARFEYIATAELKEAKKFAPSTSLNQ